MSALLSLPLLLVTSCLVSTVALAGTVNATYNSAGDVAVTASGYTATGNTVNFTLNFLPTTGTDLMVVKNTGLGFINGTFSNLTNGQTVALSYGETTYNFVANYYGGSGNDLLLVWANNRAFAWGLNGSGQLGDNTTTQHPLPAPVTATGVLAGKTLVAASAGYSHSLALCSDGTVAAWGYNAAGRLGDNTTTDRHAPIAVNAASGVSALYGKQVVAIAAGESHSLALCSDGTVAAWGDNYYWELGINTGGTHYVPGAVNTASGVSALYGKTVVAIAAGSVHSLALCSDGTLAAWGDDHSGELGDNGVSGQGAPVPVAVNRSSGVSALYGKTVVAIAAGWSHCLALCSDGTVAAWGYNLHGELGDNTTTQRLVPVAVNTASGVSALYGKTVTAIAASGEHSVALCSDGTVVTWGLNYYGELGDNTTTQRNAPVAVNTAAGVSALYGKTAMAITAGRNQSAAFCTDGTVGAWGYNTYGQLGDNTTTDRHVPVTLNATPLAAGERFTRVASGPGWHTFGLAAAPHPPAMSISANSVFIPDGGSQDFGSVPAGQSTNPVFTMSNIGGSVLAIITWTIDGPDASSFVLTTLPGSLVSGDQRTFSVGFTPTTPGAKSAVLHIMSNDPEHSPYNISLSGVGLDNVPPTITCPPNLTVAAAAGQCYPTVVLGSPVASDNSGSVTVSYSPQLTIYPLGVTRVAWTATDPSGNTTSCYQTVTVIDTNPPSITCPANVSVNADTGRCYATGVVLGTPTASDNCFSVSVTSNAPAQFPVGTTPVTWTATDSSGNTNACTQLVTVIDNQDPTITAPGTVTVNADARHCYATGVNLGTPTTSDNCGVASTGNNAPSQFPVGNTTLTWTVTDVHGRTATAPQTVTVIDNQDPTITAPANVTVNADTGHCYATGVGLGTPTTSDNCGVASTVNNAPSQFPVGDTAVTWTVTDVHGRTSSAIQTVTVKDAQPPSITCPDNISLITTNPAGKTVTFTVTATDNCSPLASLASLPASGSVFPIGSTTVTNWAIDAAGSSAGCTFEVSLTLNHNPAFSSMTATTTRDHPLTIDGAKLLGHASDPDGDPLQISGFDPGTNGAWASYDGVKVTYIPGHGFTGPDWFTATITDGRGGMVAGLVQVQVNSAPEGYNKVSLVGTNSGYLLKYAGIPGIAYEVQRSANMGAWEVLATPMADGHGVIQYFDAAPPPEGAYYRVVAP